MGSEDGKFSSSNQPDKDTRKKRGPGKRSLMLDALKANERSEEDLYQALVREAFSVLDPPGKPDNWDDELLGPYERQPFIKGFHNEVIKEVLARVNPIDKTTLPVVEVPGFLDAETPVDKLDCIIEAVGTGVIPPDTAAMLVNMVKSRMEILEIDELRKKIEAIEVKIQSEEEEEVD